MQWFRFYTEALNDPKVQSLPPELFKHWVNLMCIAGQNNGVLPSSMDQLAFLLRCDNGGANGVVTVVERLVNAGLIDRVNGGVNGYRYAMHSWEERQYKSDSSAERMKRYRKKKSDVTVTPPDLDTDTDTERDNSLRSLSTPKPPKQKIASDPDFDEFWKKYPATGRGNREKAFSAWRKAIDRASAGEIMQGLMRYCESDWIEKYGVKGAQAWLNDDRWTYDYDTKPSGNHQNSGQRVGNSGFENFRQAAANLIDEARSRQSGLV